MGIEMDSYLDFPNLGARVYPRHVPDGLGEELPGLYNTLLSTVEAFEIEDGVVPAGACILRQPRHVLLFYHDGDTVEILNKEFAIAPADATRACRALFHAFPRSRRIHLEVMFPPTELRLPKRVLYWADHMVIDLPATSEAYTASLGRRTRRHLRHDERRLRRDHDRITIETISPVGEAEKLVATFVSWKNRRFNEAGRTTLWQEKPESAGRLTELVRRCGQARVMSIDGEQAAIHFLFPVGTSVYVLQAGFDPQYLPYNLGLYGTYSVACEATAQGYQRLSLLWGTDDTKRHLGAKPRRAVRLSVFRSPTARFSSLDEAKEVAMRNLRRNGQHEYWRARHAGGRALRGLRARAMEVARNGD